MEMKVLKDLQVSMKWKIEGKNHMVLADKGVWKWEEQCLLTATSISQVVTYDMSEKRIIPFRKEIVPTPVTINQLPRDEGGHHIVEVTWTAPPRLLFASDRKAKWFIQIVQQELEYLCQHEVIESDIKLSLTLGVMLEAILEQAYERTNECHAQYITTGLLGNTGVCIVEPFRDENQRVLTAWLAENTVILGEDN